MKADEDATARRVLVGNDWIPARADVLHELKRELLIAASAARQVRREILSTEIDGEPLPECPALPTADL